MRSQAAPYDRTLTDIARLLGGLPPEDGAAFANVVSREAWQKYRVAMDTNWSRERAERFGAIAAWRDRELGGLQSACRVLLYPFGGPDILHATLFFPRCDTYVLFGLEHLGSIPPLARLPAARIDRLVADLQSSLADLFTRHYFITEDMMKELTTSDLDGITPLLLMLLGRHGARITAVDRVQLTDTGTAVPIPVAARGSPTKGALVATRVQFVADGWDRPQQVIYFRAPADNAGLSRQPLVAAYLRTLAPTTTFMKSASYLLHADAFSDLRSVILETSSAILQDDTAVPYRFFTSPWRVTLYGRYVGPVADFRYGFQADLEQAYSAATPAPLPFTFGYHWRDEGSGVMLAVRR
jgi:hypothetical protein